MKNESERKIKSTGLEKWTDEKIANYIIDLMQEAEENDAEAKNYMDRKAMIKVSVYTSDELITNREISHDAQLSPCDMLMNLTLEERDLQKKATIHSIKRSHAEENINYLRKILDDREKIK